MATPLTTSDEATMTLNVGQERSSLLEIDSNSEIRAVAFAANGKYFVCGGTAGVTVWRVEDGRQVPVSMGVQYVRCLAVSKNGRWIAAGTWNEIAVWDAQTYKRVFTHRDKAGYINGIDFSPDSTRLVAGMLNRSATVWDVATNQRVVGPLLHQDVVIAAKYSANGTRIAIATPKSVHVYDSNDGRLLIDITIQVPPWYNTGLLWLKENLFVVSDSTIKQIDASTGSEISEWQIQDSNQSSCIALPQHGEYIAYATNRSVIVWDTLACSQLGLIPHPQDICSIALSSDYRHLAIAGANGKVTVHSLSLFNNSIPLSRLHPTFQEPDIQIDDAALDAWKCDKLETAQSLLTEAIPATQEPNHHVLASRALVRARLRDWDAALADARQSIEIEPSVIGYIAKSVALVGKGEKYDGYRMCDIAFERFHSTHVSSILLIKAVIVFIAGDHIHAISRIDDLIATVPFNSICYMVQAYMHFFLGNLHMDRRDYERAIQCFERARGQMRPHMSQTLFVISLIFGWKFDNLNFMLQKQLCEALCAIGRTIEAGESLLKMVNAVNEVAYVSGPIATWASDFVQRYLSITGRTPDAVSNELHDAQLLKEWAKFKLASGSWKDACSAAASFTASRFTIYQTICERLEMLGRTKDATECFHQMTRELGGDKTLLPEQAKWILDFKQGIAKKLGLRGDTAANAQHHDEAISEYSAALSLDLSLAQDLLVKRSKAYLARSLWRNALSDANEAIKLNPSSPLGYERKHEALHEAGNYDEAIDAFKTMLSEMERSPDPEIRHRLQDYVNPAKTKETIDKAIRHAIRDTPRVLINTRSGGLLDKAQQEASFRDLPVYKEMISSMTLGIDYARIEEEVAQYYRYATFSHRWDADEPLYDKVIRIVVYDLEESRTHNKLRTFCRIVRDAGLYWAWSDTCCINKADHFVLQEALVAMFKWYEGSAVTIVYLRDVRSPSQRGDLVRSIWNTRAWTFQEYHASKVVRFYTEDWTPYMNLDIWNHKESPEITAEMEEATHVPAQTLMALHSGLDDIREKLCLASLRETTLVEDAAYSLLGVFTISMSIVYGEGDKALGRLLAQLLTSSGDTSILAWTGKSGSFNSCLPASIIVFDQLPTTHIPSIISHDEMETWTAMLRSSSLDFAQAQRLYDQLNDLHVPMFTDRRMKLPCIVFKLGPLSPYRSKPERVYRAQTNGLGVVEITTKEDLSRFGSLCLVHPWIDFLLHRHPVGTVTDTVPEGSISDHSSVMSEPLLQLSSPILAGIRTTRRTRTMPFGRLSLPFGSRSVTPPRDAVSLRPPASISEFDKRTRVLHFIVRLRQPFGALLFTPTRNNVQEYRRVAADSTIMVQVQENASWNVLLENTRVLDVL